MHRQLADGIRRLIDHGELLGGARLPSSRHLADAISVNRSTVVQAYQNLLRVGSVATGVGQGTFVSQTKAKSNSSFPEFNWSPAISGDFLRVEDSLRELMPAHSPDLIHFGQAVPDPSLYPADELMRVQRELSTQSHPGIFDYAPAAGYEPLREALRKRLGSRGIDFDQNDIMIVNGSQQALHMVASLVLSPNASAPNASAVVENPTFTGALDIFTQLKANISSVSVDEEGLNIEDLERVLSRRQHQLLYTIPTYQNPTGLSLSHERRVQLMELVSDRHVPVLEDDWLGELRDDDDAPPLKTLDRGGHVILFSTISKVLAPGLRVGWLVAPREPLEALVKLKGSLDICTNVPSQAIVCSLMESGFLDTHVNHVRTTYRHRLSVLQESIVKDFPEEAVPSKPRGGMTIWVSLPQGIDPIQVFDQARHLGVIISPGSLFSRTGQALPGFRLCYARTDTEKIRRGVKILSDVLKRLIAGKDSPSAPPEGAPMV